VMLMVRWVGVWVGACNRWYNTNSKKKKKKKKRKKKKQTGEVLVNHDKNHESCAVLWLWWRCCCFEGIILQLKLTLFSTQLLGLLWFGLE
jgi:hypothetical protein